MQSAPPSQPANRTRAKSVGECAPVATLVKRARALAALDRKLRHTLPDTLRGQCCLADIRDGRLVFLANSSVWAAKLRFYQTALLTEARMISGLKIEKFVVKVAPLPPVPPGQTRRKPLSQAAARHLRTAAQSIADPEIRDVFLRLASLAEKTDSQSRRE